MGLLLLDKQLFVLTFPVRGKPIVPVKFERQLEDMLTLKLVHTGIKLSVKPWLRHFWV